MSQREEAALAVVQAHLRVPVIQHDDQRSHGLYDLKIEYPDGRVGAVEVTAAEDEDLRARQGALRGERALLQDSRLVYCWLIILIEGASVKAARRRLSALLLKLERLGRLDAGVFSADGPEEEDTLPWLPEALAEAQVQSAKVIDGPSGSIIMAGPMRVSFLSQDPDDVVTFIEDFIDSRPSDVVKLGRAGTAERHLFIWGGLLSTGWIALRALELSVPHLPERAPVLPEEITHVWVAPEVTPPARIVVWSATTGWVQAGTIGPPTSLCGVEATMDHIGGPLVAGCSVGPVARPQRPDVADRCCRGRPAQTSYVEQVGHLPGPR